MAMDGLHVCWVLVLCSVVDVVAPHGGERTDHMAADPGRSRRGAVFTNTWAAVVGGEETYPRVLDAGRDLLHEFYHRYNATKEVDLVFVLDRSASVPKKGWSSMLNFVEDVLEHFTVDKDNTRVAIVTYSTTGSVDINDLEPGPQTDAENKCTLMRRIWSDVERKNTYGYTATYNALQRAHDVLLNTRPNAKKAILVLTDGKSNIGPPPVKVAFDILALRWNETWNREVLGPQVEIYAFGVENAYVPELRSIASVLPNHVFMIPTFSMFEQFARSLHGDLQPENWIPAEQDMCDSHCDGPQSQCMCGTRVGQYACVCGPGYEMLGLHCEACPSGYYKENSKPVPCLPCPENTTTAHTGAPSLQHCQLMPGFKECSSLPDIEYGLKFLVTGTRRDEVANTYIPCDHVTDGNSCHYECQSGFRLTSHPVMTCNRSGEWEGDIPTCEVIDCGKMEAITGPAGVPEGTLLDYVDGRTTYRAGIKASCEAGRVPMGDTRWSCDGHGRWTRPSNFQCAVTRCDPLTLGPFLLAEPSECSQGHPLHGTHCRLGCEAGFTLEGPTTATTCSYQGRALWQPEVAAYCRDVEPPTIVCPADSEVSVADPGHTSTTVHFQRHPPGIRDNSGWANYSIHGAPPSGEFGVGHTMLTYVATDAAGNSASCTRNIEVKSKGATIVFCPSDVKAVIDNPERVVAVTWVQPQFTDPENTTMEYTCNKASGSEFTSGVTEVTCYPNDFPNVQCLIKVTVTEPECVIPYADRTPVHGALICASNDYLYRRFCRVVCKAGYEVYRDQKPEAHFKCHWDGTWHGDFAADGLWPDCTKSRRPDKAHMINDLHVRFDGQCEDARDVIIQAFMETIRRILDTEYGVCKEPHHCNVQDVQVMCGSRARRAALSSARGRSSHRRRHIAAESDSRVARDSATGGATVVVRFTTTVESRRPLNGTAPDGGHVTSADQEAMLVNLNVIYFNITEKIEDVDDGFPLMLNGTVVAASDSIEDVVYPGFLSNCSETELHITDDDPYEGIGIYGICVQCPVGTYSTNGSCEVCPRDTYQEAEGMDGCTACPNGTVTHWSGARNLSECQAPCEAGSFSTSGYQPCEACDLGWYQNEATMTSCERCPNDTSTRYAGSSNVSHCLDFCQPHTISRDGLAPCRPCVKGLAQPLAGQSHCVRCSGNDTEANSTAAATSPACPEMVDCFETNTTCEHGECYLVAGRSTCLCNEGFIGDACEAEVDDCAGVDCNNGTCVDGHMSFTCDCFLGYHGPFCSEEVDECLSHPCHNNGSCLDELAAFTCVCPAGYNGTQCEQRIDTCARQPCLHGNCTTLLTDESQTFSCACEPGYTGSHCEKLIDFCSVVTCANGGHCNWTPGAYHCICPVGFTGGRCETEIDYCESQPCSPGGECHNARAGYHCTCFNGFYGHQCDQVALSDFDLVFGEPSITQYVQHAIWRPLEEIAVCLWLRTSDASNYGTLLSYAGESNWLNAQYADVFSLLDYGSLRFIVNGESVYTGVALNDGRWQHLCVQWSGETGSWEVFINGTRMLYGESLSAHTFIERGGSLIVGQRQGSPGTDFQWRESFVGELSQLNIYDHWLNDSDVRHIANQSKCALGNGNVVTWSSHLTQLYGGVVIRNESRCLDTNECLLGATCADDEICEDTKDGHVCRRCHDDDECPASIRVTGACDRNPCENGGHCLEDGDHYRCLCPPYFTGSECQLHVTTCDALECENNGTCIQDDDTAYCDCVPPWKGRLCNAKHSPTCLHAPCLNNGTCGFNTTGAYYFCTCPDDGRRYGDNCEILSACHSPGACLNGAICVESETDADGEAEDAVLCLCQAGYTGTRCDTPPGGHDVTTTSVQSTVSDDLEVTTEGKDVQEENMCRSVHCLHGGSCRNTGHSFVCDCTQDYKGQYCDTERIQELRKYQVTVNLQMDYLPGLKDNILFLQRFRKEVHRVYQAVTGSIHVDVQDVRDGSTMVDFNLLHTVYLDETSPGPELMKDELYNQLARGFLGEFPASLHGFRFNYVDPDGDELHWGFYLLIAIAFLVLLILVIFGLKIWIRHRRLRARRFRKMNNEPRPVNVRIHNPTFDSTPRDRPTTPQMRPTNEENIYADVTEPMPYAVTTLSDKDKDEFDRKFPSKQGKDTNKMWALRQRQMIPLPPKPGEKEELPGKLLAAQAAANGREDSGGYLQPCQGNPPPPYRDLSHHGGSPPPPPFSAARLSPNHRALPAGKTLNVGGGGGVGVGVGGGTPGVIRPMSAEEEALDLVRDSPERPYCHDNLAMHGDDDDDLYLKPRSGLGRPGCYVTTEGNPCHVFATRAASNPMYGKPEDGDVVRGTSYAQEAPAYLPIQPSSPKEEVAVTEADYLPIQPATPPHMKRYMKGSAPSRENSSNDLKESERNSPDKCEKKDLTTSNNVQKGDKKDAQGHTDSGSDSDTKSSKSDAVYAIKKD